MAQRDAFFFFFAPFLSFCLCHRAIYLLALVYTQNRKLRERPRPIMVQQAHRKWHASTIRYARGVYVKTSPAISFWMGMLVGYMVLAAVYRSSIYSARFFTERGTITRANHYSAPDKLRALSRPAVTRVSLLRTARDSMDTKSETATKGFPHRADLDNSCSHGGS